MQVCCSDCLRTTSLGDTQLSTLLSCILSRSAASPDGWNVSQSASAKRVGCLRWYTKSSMSDLVSSQVLNTRCTKGGAPASSTGHPLKRYCSTKSCMPRKSGLAGCRSVATFTQSSIHSDPLMSRHQVFDLEQGCVVSALWQNLLGQGLHACLQILVPASDPGRHPCQSQAWKSQHWQCQTARNAPSSS